MVHNGIIENYLSLRESLHRHGKAFVSETDTEVVAQLLDYYYQGNILEAMVKVLQKVEGSYALGVICAERPDEIIAVRKDSPLIVGLGEHENFTLRCARNSSKTRSIYRLNDNEIAVLKCVTPFVYNLV